MEIISTFTDHVDNQCLSLFTFDDDSGKHERACMYVIPNDIIIFDEETYTYKIAYRLDSNLHSFLYKKCSQQRKNLLKAPRSLPNPLTRGIVKHNLNVVSTYHANEVCILLRMSSIFYL